MAGLEHVARSGGVAGPGAADPADGAPAPLPVGEPVGEPAPQGAGADRRRAFSGGLWNAASSVLPMGTTLLLSVVISRHLGAEALGRQSYIAYVGATLVAVLIYSFTAASVQLLAAAVGAEDEARLAWISRWGFTAHLTGGAVTAGAMVAVGLGDRGERLLWLLAAVTALSDAVGWAYASRDIARRGWSATASRRLVAQALSPLLAIVAVYAGAGIRGVFMAQLTVSLVLTVVLRHVDRTGPRWHRGGHPAPPWRPVMRLWLAFSLSILISQIIDKRLETVFLNHYRDARAVAMYSVAYSIVSLGVTLSGTLIGAAAPAIAARHAREPEAVRESFSRAVRVVLVVNLVLAAGTVSVAARLVPVVYGGGFDQAGALVRWLGLSLLVVPLGQLYSTYWSGIGQLRPVLLAGAVGAVVDVALAWALVPTFSTGGAATASVCAQLANALVFLVHARRRAVRVDLRPGRLAIAVVLSALTCAASAAAGSLVPGLPGGLLAAAVFLVLAAVGARLVGLFDPADVEWLAGTIPAPAARMLRQFSPRPATGLRRAPRLRGAGGPPRPRPGRPRHRA